MPTFIIKGQPISLVRQDKLTQGYWDDLKKHKHEAVNQLEDQTKDIKPFEKPVHVEVNFYFVPKGTHKPLHPHGYNHSRPDISDLIRFVENITNGILFKDPSIISSITSVKKYSDQSRTEIIITELKND